MDEFDYYNLITRVDLHGFVAAEKKAAETAKRISELKAFLPVGVKDSDLKAVIRDIDRAKAQAARAADLSDKRAAAALNRSGNAGRNPFTVEGLGRTAGSIAVIAALDRGLHGLAEGMEEYNKAIEKGETGWRAFAEGFGKSLPIFREGVALGEQIVIAVNRANTLKELPAALKDKDFFRLDPGAEDKLNVGRDARAAADRIAEEQNRRIELESRSGFEQQRERVRQEAFERESNLERIRLQSPDGSESVDEAIAKGRVADQLQLDTIAEKETERITSIVDKFFGEIEDDFTKKSERVGDSLDDFFGAVERGAGRDARHAADLRGEAGEIDLRTGGKPGAAMVARIERELSSALEEAGENTDLRGALVENANAQLRALIPHAGQMAAAIAGDPNLTSLTSGDSSGKESLDQLKKLVREAEDTNRLLRNPPPAKTS